MIGLFTLVGAVLWYLIDIFKRGVNSLREAKKFNVADIVYDLVVWVAAVALGMVLAFQFKLDAFVLVSQLMDNVIPVPEVEPTLLGYIFGGLTLASGSGFMNGLLKAIGKKGPDTIPVFIEDERVK